VERDPQVLHNQSITSFQHPRAGTFRTIRPPWRFSRTPVEVKRPPLKGEHTGEILKELGYTDNEIAEFERTQVV
jgi:crotonobetainyl-CoA:carnitine CoA-transferase CaiB-like acyl-CoA transferase